MKGRWTGLALAVAVGAAPAFADNARPRGGGSSGGGHSAGRSHHSGGGSAHRSGGGSSYSGSPSGGARPRTGAEARHPRAGTGTGPRYYRGYGYPYYGYGYRYPYYGYGPYYYDYWPYWGASFWYSPYYWGGYGYGYGPAYGHGYSDESGAVRTFVEPAETKVHVDGRYAGTADDFDGLMQRLYVSPGAHELMLSLEGYKTHRVKIYVAPGGTLKLHYDMVKGSGEDAQIDTLGNPEDERFGRRQRPYDDEDDAESDEVRREDRGAPQERGGESPAMGLSWGDELGTVRLAIQPGDASVYVDGRFKGPAGGLRSLRLSPGKHRIEIVRPGFRTEERDIDVRDGEDTTLELEMSRS
jgi:hypothetical protein